MVIDNGNLVGALDDQGSPLECPITLAPLTSPVLLRDGGIYEEVAIQEWLKTHDRAPCTNVAVKDKSMFRMSCLKDVFESYLQQCDFANIRSHSDVLNTVLNNIELEQHRTLGLESERQVGHVDACNSSGAV
eukprot:TRINITY_DN77499_c0_g1_i1.p1 TRINITY_DN77499_c0_g1~~TRINITY_DN77499_c0_g1_i1.p1  ORF type:complete len:141 (+),score=16.55 TRINITY_DN77499_c0_g1_i1:30-425(+)